MQTHYTLLGISEKATREEIRKAYRKLVLKLHPDKAKDPNSVDKFLKVKEAYEILTDNAKRRAYDLYLESKRQNTHKQTYTQQSTTAHTAHTTQKNHKQQAENLTDISARLMEAVTLWSQGKYDKAEALAKWLLKRNAKLPMPHAILGDIARQRGDLNSALAHYSYAIQFDPKNKTFQARYEEVFRQVGNVDRIGRVERKQPSYAVLWVAAVATICGLIYVSMVRESPAFPNFSAISSWTPGLMIMIFINGIIVGAMLSLMNFVDRWESEMRSSTGRLGLGAVISFIALINYWVGTGVYLLLGYAQKSFTYSVSRLLASIAALVLFYSFASSLSPTLIWQQTLLWSGSVALVGVVCGWAVADGFR